jgi:hypothetical protein
MFITVCNVQQAKDNRRDAFLLGDETVLMTAQMKVTMTDYSILILFSVRLGDSHLKML